MSLIKIVCNKCGFSKEVALSTLPRKPLKATCPHCKHVFDFDPTNAARQELTDQNDQQSPLKTNDEVISLKKGLDTKANKNMFAFFLVLILLSVGVRLWADSRFRAVPYPNLMAASSEGVAVSCGETVYVYAADGSLLHSYSLPGDVRPTQLFWDKGTLCLSDMKSKTILELGKRGDTKQTFSGASISAQFKVTREPGTGRLFVSDSASHRILIFDEAGKYQSSFGKEGINAGEFKFPNEMIFDETGQLLIANTKLPAIEIYSPDGQFKSTLVKPNGDRIYRFPTDFAITSDRLLVLENDGFLDRAKIRSYDRKGNKTAEVQIGDAKVIGDIVTVDNRLLMTDCDNRQLTAFSLVDLHQIGPFSSDFAGKCSKWNSEANLFKTISQVALIALLVFCAPVIYFYARMKREETKQLAQMDVNALAGQVTGTEAKVTSDDLILGTPVNERLQRVSYIFFGVGILSISLALIYTKIGVKPPSTMVIALILGQLTFFVGVVLLVRSGGFSSFKRKQTISIFKKIVRDGMLELLPTERVERIALAQHSQSAQDIVLLLFMSKRLLLYYLSWNRVVKIEQYPFEAITKVTPPSGGILTIVQNMQVTVIVDGISQELKYYNQKADFLLLLCNEFRQRIGKTSGLPYGKLCLTCRQPLQGDYCARCSTKLAPDLRAMWLSLLFPGLGQLRNGELQKGLVYIILTVFSLLVAYMGIKGWLFEGADLTPTQKINVSVMIAMAPIWYVFNIIDAYRSSTRGRKTQ